jgi:hypothetical protein
LTASLKLARDEATALSEQAQKVPLGTKRASIARTTRRER